MSPSPRGRQQRCHLLPEGGQSRRLVRVALAAPLVVLLSVVVAMTVYCRALLVDATEGRAVVIGDLPLVLLAGGFVLASAAVVVAQSVRVASRVAGPEHRLRQALQRIRSGDVGFRVHLRRGDLLIGLADECNALLDWLNDNPPVGVRTGSDVVQVDLPRTPRAEPVPQEVAP